MISCSIRSNIFDQVSFYVPEVKDGYALVRAWDDTICFGIVCVELFEFHDIANFEKLLAKIQLYYTFS